MWGCSFSMPGFPGPLFFWNGGLLGLLLKLLLLAAVVWAILRIASAIRGKDAQGCDRSHSLRILRVKYARGEISEDEFRRMREVIES